jgi:methylase of polypeptide subunit release factors
MLLTPAQSALLQLGRVLQRDGYDFVTISTPSHRRVNARSGNEQATDLRGVFGWSRPFSATLLSQEYMRLMREAGILDASEGQLRSALRASTLDGQLYFHSAFPTRARDAVFFGPDTYRYARVIRTALKEQPSGQIQRAVDIGCGAGPGAVTLSMLLPHAEVWGVDINPKALELAEVNVALAGAGNVHCGYSDLLAGVDGEFDLIVANPPFMADASERIYCSGGGQLGEGLSVDIVDCALTRLAPGGRLLMYTCVAINGGNDPFRDRIGGMLNAAGLIWDYHELDPDVFGGELGSEKYQHTDRIAAVVLSAARCRRAVV